MHNAAAPSGLVLFPKQAGLTSFAAIGAIKRALGTGKVGHTGTLDKFAEGLLVALTGRALKLSPWFTHCDKQYEGLIRFGAETDTLDPEGAVIASADLPSLATVEAVLPQFTGSIMQEPPVYSAIHVDGKRASARARGGETVEMRKRPVNIYRLELLAWEPPCARIFVHCSSGAYIRSLARDIAIAAGSRAHLSALIRTRVAGFALEDAKETAVLPIDTSVFESLGLPWFEVDQADVQKIVTGKPLAPVLAGKSLTAPQRPREPLASSVAGVFHGGAFIAMLEQSGGVWRYGYVYAR